MGKQGKKYSGIHIRPTGNGHMVDVHRPMSKEDSSSPMSPDGPGESGMHFGTAEEAAAHAQSVMSGHDAEGKPAKASHPLRGAFGKKNDHDEEDQA